MKANADNPAKPMDIQVNRERLRKDVQRLTAMVPPRNAKNAASLDKSAKYIFEEFCKTGGRTGFQTFAQDDQEYKNVI